MLYIIVSLLVIYFLYTLYIRSKKDNLNYVVGLDQGRRGSVALRGWNQSSLYQRRPIIIDDLTPLI